MAYTIGEVAARTGLTASTLRYYESEKLLSPIKRDAANRRRYGKGDMDWLDLITCLKNTGMPLQEIRRFVALCGQGDVTLEQRYNIVLAHRQATMARIAALQNELAHIDRKVAYYHAACTAAQGTDTGRTTDPHCEGGAQL